MKKAASRIAALSIAAHFALVVEAVAQRIPDAGSTLRDLEQSSRELPERAPKSPAMSSEVRAALSSESTVRFLLKGWRITGNSAITEAELLPLISDLPDTEVGFAQLHEGAARLTRYYRSRGYPLARAYLPAQDIEHGVVEVAVLEGRFGKVTFENDSHVRDDVLIRYLAPLRGQLVKDHTFERRLLLLYDLPGTGYAK